MSNMIKYAAEYTYKHKETRQEHNCIYLNELKHVNITETKKITLDIFRPQLGFAENPFAPSLIHEPAGTQERLGTAKRLLPSSVPHTKVARRATVC